MPHDSNIAAFGAAARSTNDLIRAYCGLVALELELKARVTLTNHDVCTALLRLKNTLAVGAKSWTAPTFVSLAAQLRNDIARICVNDKDGSPRFAPGDCYPYIRYTRLAIDAWPPPCATAIEVVTLANTVSRVRAFIRSNF